MLALPLSASTTILLLTAGVGLICLELNRPGRVVPGCIGLLSLLIGIASADRSPHPNLSIVAFVLALLFAFLDTRRPHLLLSATVIAGFAISFAALSIGASFLTHLLAGVCITALGLATHLLARIAAQARSNKISKTASRRLD